MFLSKKSLNRSIQSAVRLDVYAEMCLQSFTDPCERHTFAEHKKHSCPVNPHHYSYFENMGATTLRILTLCQEHVCHLLSIKHKLIVWFGITILFWWSNSQIKKVRTSSHALHIAHNGLKLFLNDNICLYSFVTYER